MLKHDWSQNWSEGQGIKDEILKHSTGIKIHIIFLLQESLDDPLPFLS